MHKEQISGRSEEKKRLQELLESPDPQLLAVYGRRRVGKTFLITRFFGTFAFEMTGIHDAPVGKQLANFAEALGTDCIPSGWLEAFRLLRKHLEKKKRGLKQVVFFDELPWLASRKSGFLPAFEHFWNSWGSRQPDLLVVVCGSAAAWMIRKIVNQRGGLHGRVTSQMELCPFNLREAHDYLRSRNFPDSRTQTLELYMAVGGVPLYLQKARPELSAAQNIDALCFPPGAPLRHEFDQIYASLFEHHDRHLQIIRTLADVQQGLTRPEIQLKSNLASGGTLSQTLEELHRSGFITITVPFGRTRRDALYRLTDEFSLFHLRWIEKRKAQDGSSDYWLQMRSTPRWNAWSGFAFENICLKHAKQIKAALGISGVQADISAWRDSGKNTGAGGAQIDLLMDRKDGVINVCELKYSAAPFTIDKKYAAELRNKLAVFQSAAHPRKTLFLTMVTSCGVADNPYSRELVVNRVEADALFSS